MINIMLNLNSFDRIIHIVPTGSAVEADKCIVRFGVLANV